MARLDSGYLPRQNLCRSAAKPIARPDWIESDAGRTSFLWYCRAATTASRRSRFYEQSHPDSLAA